MGIDAVGRAGDEGAQILIGVDFQPLGLIGQDNADPVHFVGEDLLHGAQAENITLRDLVKIREQPGRGQAAMSGQNAVGALSAHGQRTALDMSHGDLQHLFIRGVIDGQADAEGRDLHGAHDARARHIQGLKIAGVLLRRRVPAVGKPAQIFVELLRLLPQRFVSVAVHVGDRFHIGGNRRALMEGVPVVADGGIQQQRQAKDQYQKKENRRRMLFHLASPHCCILGDISIVRGRRKRSVSPGLPSELRQLQITIGCNQPRVSMRFLVMSRMAAKATSRPPST